MKKEQEVLRKNLSFSLNGKRLGKFDKEHAPLKESDALNEMATRLNLHGGYFQQNREIRDKQKSLERALLYSYQGAWIKKLYDNNSKAEEKRVLINPNKVKQDYDEKIISAPFEYEYAAGDVVEWVGTNTFWLIYLQELTELAYFRGHIRRCSYEIKWNNGSTYAAVKGPSEKNINSENKHNISIDVPNYSLTLLIPKTSANIKQFKRYSKFFLSSELNEEKKCWRVEAVDDISTPGIMEVAANEYYYNKDVDDLDNGIVDGLIKDVENPNKNEVEETIIGPTFIKPRTINNYKFNGKLISEWKIKSNLPVKIKKIDDYEIEVYWDSSYSGEFTINYGDYTKIVVVESLF